MIYRSKDTGQRKNPNARKIFFRAVNEYRRRRKAFRGMRINDYQDYIVKNKDSEKNFKGLLDSLEDLRCSMGMGDEFYALVAEFTLQPNQQYYYNPTWLFAKSSFMSEEFEHRIFTILPLISATIGEENEVREVLDFISKIDKLHVNVDVKSAGMLRTKDWYCIKAIMKAIKRRGWTEEDFLNKVVKFYRSRVRKVYTEKLLEDVASGQLDNIVEKKPEKKGPRKPKNIKAIEKSPWFEEWAAGIPG